MRVRTFISGLVYLPVNAVLFGAGAIAVLSIQLLNERAAVLIPVVVAMSLMLAAPIAWTIAPRLRARYRANRR